jgi:hypothetical protein
MFRELVIKSYLVVNIINNKQGVNMKRLVDLPIMEDEEDVDFVGHDDPVDDDDLFIVDYLDGEWVELSIDIQDLKVLGLDKDYIQLVFYDNDSWAHA